MIDRIIETALAAIFGKRLPPQRYRRKVTSVYELEGKHPGCAVPFLGIVRRHDADRCTMRRCIQPVMMARDSTMRAFSGSDALPSYTPYHEMDLHTGDIFTYVADERKKRR